MGGHASQGLLSRLGAFPQLCLLQVPGQVTIHTYLIAGNKLSKNRRADSNMQETGVESTAAPRGSATIQFGMVALDTR